MVTILGYEYSGEDLLAIAADQPFRFPATFTFVVRAFSGNCLLNSPLISIYDPI